MKRKISLFFVTLLAMFSITACVYACVPDFYWFPPDAQQGCPGLYKNSRWKVQVVFGSSGPVHNTVYTSGSGGCGYETACGGAFSGWEECYPGFHPPQASSGCWKQAITDYSANCISTDCYDATYSIVCQCQSGVTNTSSYTVGPAYCTGC